MSGLPAIDGVTGLSEIGRGGFGVVYRGTETEFDREVAVKVLMPTLDERTRMRFERERRAMGAVSDHPNIVTVYRGGLTDSQQPYLVMEFLRGGSLQDRIQTHGPLDWRDAATIGAKLADALAVAHRAGILHRDVKPGNVFQTHNGEPKLGDFGIARLDDGQDSRTGSITASVAHAPPEIVDGQRGDERSDLYSLASTIYALTKGHAPFSRDPDQGLTALLGKVANEAPPPLHLESAAIDFERTLLKALSKRPDDRHQTMTEFGNELRRAAAAPVTRPIGVGNQTTAVDPSVATNQGVQPLTGAAVGAPAKRQTSSGQIAFLALLALAIAGLGGWGIARAVLDDDSDRQGLAAGLDEPTSAVEPTPEPTDAAEPSVAPTEEPTAQPTAEPTPEPTEQQAVAPTAAPTATSPPATPTPRSTGLGGGTRNAGFTTVGDFSGAISVAVPEAWSLTVQDGSDVPLEDEGLEGVRVLSAGGTLQQLNGEPDTRDLSISGIYVFAARVGPGAETAGILEVGQSYWTDCTPGEQSEIQLLDGLAQYHLTECDRDGGDSTGVVVLALIPDSDPEVAVSVFLQFADIADLNSLPMILTTLDIDPSSIPALDSSG